MSNSTVYDIISSNLELINKIITIMVIIITEHRKLKMEKFLPHLSANNIPVPFQDPFRKCLSSKSDNFTK